METARNSPSAKIACTGRPPVMTRKTCPGTADLPRNINDGRNCHATFTFSKFGSVFRIYLFKFSDKVFEGDRNIRVQGCERFTPVDPIPQKLLIEQPLTNDDIGHR